jgi:hypothetical protein
MAEKQPEELDKKPCGLENPIPPPVKISGRDTIVRIQDQKHPPVTGVAEPGDQLRC